MINEESKKNNEPLIIAKNLKKYFVIKGKELLHAVDDISFEVNSGETMALVGESGCGKSTVGNVIMRLHPPTAGTLMYNGIDVFKANDMQSMVLRKKMQLVFQDPFSSLNPRKTVRKIISEAFEIHKYGSKEDIAKAVKESCERVQFPLNLLDYYPHELDGGMRQVVGIARALSLRPDFIVCDEPVSSLDVSIQARIINLLMDLQKDMGIAYLFISHDLSVVRHISKKIAIMYLGQIVEMAETEMIFAETLHPYSIALLSAVPRIDVESKRSRIVLVGDVPSPMNPKPGCRFAPRCWMAHDDCNNEDPPLREVSPGHKVACFYAEEAVERSKIIQKVKLD